MVVTVEHWIAHASDGTEYRITIRIEPGMQLRAEWQTIPVSDVSGRIDSPFKAQEKMDADFKDRAVWALVNLCCETMRRQGLKVSKTQKVAD